MSGPHELVVIEDVRVQFEARRSLTLVAKRGIVHAVDGVSLGIHRGETLGLVGESGCGKSTLGRAILRLERIGAGRVVFDGVDLGSLAPTGLRRTRARMQMVFQDASGSLDPRMPVAALIAEPLRIHGWPLTQRAARVKELLELVGLSREASLRRPHELSGGQRQRVGIARALALRPDFIICDEPVSALDVSIQAQIVNLLADLRDAFKLTLLFIAHDLSVVRHISDRVAVMYLGKIVELAKSADIYDRPLHPYTQALLSSVPLPDPKVERQRRYQALRGEVPSPASPPSGCRFHTRCPMARDVCAQREPPLDAKEGEHLVACHFAVAAPADASAVAVRVAST